MGTDPEASHSPVGRAPSPGTVHVTISSRAHKSCLTADALWAVTCKPDTLWEPSRVLRRMRVSRKQAPGAAHAGVMQKAGPSAPRQPRIQMTKDSPPYPRGECRSQRQRSGRNRKKQPGQNRKLAECLTISETVISIFIRKDPKTVGEHLHFQ